MIANILMWGSVAIVAILLFRGLSTANTVKAFLHLVAAAVAAVGALLLSGPTVAGLDTQLIDALASALPSVADAITAMPSLYPFLLGLLRPLVFLFLYFVLVFVLRLVLFLISIFLPKRHKSGGIPVFAGVCGLLRGCILVVVLLTPILGYASVGNAAITAYVEASEAGAAEDAAAEKLVAIRDKVLVPIEEHAMLGKLSSVTGKLFDEMVTTELSEEKASPTEELPIFAKIFYHTRWLIGKPLAEFGDGEKTALGEISGLFDESVFLPTVSAEVLSTMTGKWADGETFLGLARPSLEGSAGTVADSLFDVLATSTKETVTADVGTVADLMILMIDYDLLGATEDEMFDRMTAVNAATGKTFVEEAIALLDANAHMAPLRNSITTLAMEAIGSALGSTEELRENYGDMVDEMVGVLGTVEGSTNEEKIENLTTVFKDGLTENGLDVPESVVDEASRLILDELEAKDVELSDLTADDIFDILDSYLAAGAATN